MPTFKEMSIIYEDSPLIEDYTNVIAHNDEIIVPPTIPHELLSSDNDSPYVATYEQEHELEPEPNASSTEEHEVSDMSNASTSTSPIPVRRRIRIQANCKPYVRSARQVVGTCSYKHADNPHCLTHYTTDPYLLKSSVCNRAVVSGDDPVVTAKSNYFRLMRNDSQKLQTQKSQTLESRNNLNESVELPPLYTRTSPYSNLTPTPTQPTRSTTSSPSPSPYDSCSSPSDDAFSVSEGGPRICVRVHGQPLTEIAHMDTQAITTSLFPPTQTDLHSHTNTHNTNRHNTRKQPSQHPEDMEEDLNTLEMREVFTLPDTESGFEVHVVGGEEDQRIKIRTQDGDGESEPEHTPTQQTRYIQPDNNTETSTEPALSTTISRSGSTVSLASTTPINTTGKTAHSTTSKHNTSTSTVQVKVRARRVTRAPLPSLARVSTQKPPHPLPPTSSKSIVHTPGALNSQARSQLTMNALLKGDSRNIRDNLQLIQGTKTNIMPVKVMNTTTGRIQRVFRSWEQLLFEGKRTVYGGPSANETRRSSQTSAVITGDSGNEGVSNNENNTTTTDDTTGTDTTV